MTLPVRRGNGAPERPMPMWDPFSELENLWGEMGRFFQRTAAPLTRGEERPWMPMAEEEETDDAYLVRAELPGIPKENVSVELCDNDLCIDGELDEEQRDRVLSRRSGRFSYRTSLPAGVDTDRIEADLNDGILTVRIPKTDQARRRKIQLGGGR